MEKRKDGQPKKPAGRPKGAMNKIDRPVPTGALQVVGATEEHPYGFTKRGTPRKKRSPEMVTHAIPRAAIMMKNPNSKRAEYKRQGYERNVREYDYLKYHRIVFTWARRKFKVCTIEIEMCLFLYSEYIFTATKLKEYANIMPFDKRKLERLIRVGLVQTWRDETNTKHKLYELTRGAKTMVNQIYKKLNLEDKISEFPENNEIMKRLTFQDKRTAIGIKQFNSRVEENWKRMKHPSLAHTVKKKSVGI